jgi:hypothetical protein
VEKKKLAPIPARDVTYAAPAFPPNNDMFVVIVLGANSKSKHVVRAHVFKCDTTDVAAKIVELLMRAASSASSKAYVAKIEDDLLRRKLIEPSVDRSSYVLGNFHQPRASLCSTSSVGNPAPVFAASSQPAANGGVRLTHKTCVCFFVCCLVDSYLKRMIHCYLAIKYSFICRYYE